MARIDDGSQALDKTALTTVEADQLAVCEAVVDEGLRTFVEVGQALVRIRDGRLYRASHGTFEAYAHERFGIGKAYAHRMIGAAAVGMSPMGNKITSERQARELVPLLGDPARMREVVERAEASGSVTAASLRAARDGATTLHALRDRLKAEFVKTAWTPEMQEAMDDEQRPIIDFDRADFADDREWITAWKCSFASEQAWAEDFTVRLRDWLDAARRLLRLLPSPAAAALYALWTSGDTEFVASNPDLADLTIARLLGWWSS